MHMYLIHFITSLYCFKMPGGPRPLDYVVKQEEPTERLKRKLEDGLFSLNVA